MHALSIPVTSPYQPQHAPDQSHAPEVLVHESFASRAAGVDRLIDAKASLVMDSARLRALATSNPESSERCFALIQTLEEKINGLQEQIDRELKGLLYGLQKAPAPSPFLDNLPG